MRRTPIVELTVGEVVVGGAGVAGSSAARHLLAADVPVVVADTRFADAQDAGVPVAAELRAAGARCVGIDELLADPGWTDRTGLVVVSPGFAPTHQLVVAAAAAGVPVWGEVELAWRIDRAGWFGTPRTWLVVTGTNGKTTTTSMLESIVSADGRVAAACGNIGLPVLDALATEPRAEVLCAELSSFQLHWAPSIVPDAGVVLNVAEDHLDWHGSFGAYRDAKATALHGRVGVVGLDDAVASGIETGTATRRVGFTLAAPDAGQLGVDDGVLVDRAFGAGRLIPAAQVRPAGPSGCSDALAAAALALAVGVAPLSVTAGLTDFTPAAHRGEVVETIDGIDFVDDSKATNPHAARAAIAAHDRVVLIAGGLLKGASVDDLFVEMRDRLAGAVAIGTDRDVIIDSIARHAPDVPAVTVFTGDDGAVNVQRFVAGVPVAENPGPAGAESPADLVMRHAVRQAWRLAVEANSAPGSEPVEAVLLAPAAASLDMFAGYGRRGDSFAVAARGLRGTDVSASR
ncbi:UDP-N-acetylmuramoyl-L-alanine--D-glutamate ligase [Gordonia pseudamarae]|uniref:UDP-N-acetylmuramoyl-L-alanine--D-glutamate ligase n=1 Tax=Gordonia TaxID=2053 RepID=UPI0019A73421|nr:MULTISPECIES: UDP-N-acetylmuramoyl-L-alanine--D-glutamate ligase [Gordonia]MBD0022649.1 UDP-N-acetylmuramoyl-L-alanine--D-glutamate ligase [Gordonia sp. (in: high G+C Gram-positive bacteria)]QHN26797.1 UDP-N-acetylmuramoyl-L-alanine--D-glutamate ligase [Gordonia pseudamarae]